MNKLILTFLVFLTAVAIGCGPKTIYDQPVADESKGYYEWGWVEPKVVLEDPWYTMVRSSRVDSFYVAPGEGTPLSQRSIQFKVTSYECLAIVTLLNGRSEVVRPLLAKNLASGYYKLTLNVGQIRKNKMPEDNYYLKAEYCGFTVIQDLGRF